MSERTDTQSPDPVPPDPPIPPDDHEHRMGDVWSEPRYFMPVYHHQFTTTSVADGRCAETMELLDPNDEPMSLRLVVNAVTGILMRPRVTSDAAILKSRVAHGRSCLVKRGPQPGTPEYFAMLERIEKARTTKYWYCLDTYNCQHFASWINDGVPVSGQATAGNVGLAAGAFAGVISAAAVSSSLLVTAGSVKPFKGNGVGSAIGNVVCRAAAVLSVCVLTIAILLLVVIVVMLAVYLPVTNAIHSGSRAESGPPCCCSTILRDPNRFVFPRHSGLALPM